ncbi:hypothetical protein AO354_25890 [Pseudomonas syringae pv. syringae]|nr:hypothetical protein AO354_25890 [Pseudomonas syringae pv. syringae]RMT34981.1 Fatty acid desaturase [Pseudomonas syringae pv. solidagae]
MTHSVVWSALTMVTGPSHHLFPGWSHRHYPALANIIADLAPRHGLHYRCIDYRELLRQQRKFLRSMGRDAQVTNIT